MPGGDRTGPAGRGPMTGRGLGDCAGFSRPGRTAERNAPGFGGLCLITALIGLGALWFSRKRKDA